VAGTVNSDGTSLLTSRFAAKWGWKKGRQISILIARPLKEAKGNRLD